MLSIKGHRNPDGSFDWKDAIIDAGILSGLTFFTNLAGKLAIASPIVFGEALVQAVIQFFAFLAIKRGLTKPIEKGEVVSSSPSKKVVK